MDLIQTMTEQLGVSSGQAQGLAGGLLRLVQSGLKDEVGEDAANQLESAVPEMKAWEAEAPQEAESPLGGLLQTGLSALGGSQAGLAGAAVALLEKVGLQSDKAALIGPILGKFLESRLDPELLGKIQPVLGLLNLGQGGGSGLGGALSGLFG